MNITELTGTGLNYWVARAENLKIGRLEEDDPDSLGVIIGGFVKVIKCRSSITLLRHGTYWPSTDWAVGGPIIEREHIILADDRKDGIDCWRAGHPADKYYRWGATYLEAAMRTYVASKFGDELLWPL